MPDCFIIMPISTPEVLVPTYGGDNDHFKHVLECLFMPAVELSGLKSILPIAQGADVIHAEVVQNLEKADLVLCDMSSLNANVFFELGIRTAIGKPVCMVKDDVTPKVPFDMTVVNYHQYPSALAPWTLDADIEKLAEHIKSSRERSRGENLLWQYFSLSRRAHLESSKPEDETQARLAMLSQQVEGLSKKLDMKERPPTEFVRQTLGLDVRPVPNESNFQMAHRGLTQYMDLHKVEYVGVDITSDGYIEVLTRRLPPAPNQIAMLAIAQKWGVPLKFTFAAPPAPEAASNK